MATFTLRLEDYEKDEFMSICSTLNKIPSEVIRQFINDYIDKNHPLAYDYAAALHIIKTQDFNAYDLPIDSEKLKAITYRDFLKMNIPDAVSFFQSCIIDNQED